MTFEEKLAAHAAASDRIVARAAGRRPNPAGVIAKFGFNDGTEKKVSFATVEGAILGYRKLRKARRVADRARQFSYSMDGGSSWYMGNAGQRANPAGRSERQIRDDIKAAKRILDATPPGTPARQAALQVFANFQKELGAIELARLPRRNPAGEKVQLRYRYKGGILGKPIQIGKRLSFPKEDAETIRNSLDYPKAIVIEPVRRTNPAPKLRRGERQGDIFANVEEPFALAGQKGTDHERRQREKEAKAKATRDFATRNQLDFETNPRRNGKPLRVRKLSPAQLRAGFGGKARRRNPVRKLTQAGKKALLDHLKALAITHEGSYQLESIYIQQTGETPPANSGRLVDFLNAHFRRYPEDIARDLPGLAPDFRVNPARRNGHVRKLS
jgi:hypothetical protein